MKIRICIILLLGGFVWWRWSAEDADDPIPTEQLTVCSHTDSGRWQCHTGADLLEDYVPLPEARDV